jgi:hypothetical protein
VATRRKADCCSASVASSSRLACSSKRAAALAVAVRGTHGRQLISFRLPLTKCRFALTERWAEAVSLCLLASQRAQMRVPTSLLAADLSGAELGGGGGPDFVEFFWHPYQRDTDLY